MPTTQHQVVRHETDSPIIYVSTALELMKGGVLEPCIFPEFLQVTSEKGGNVNLNMPNVPRGQLLYIL